MGDADVDEMFHTFMLEEGLQPYVRVNFGQFDFDPSELRELASLLMKVKERDEVFTWVEMKRYRRGKMDKDMYGDATISLSIHIRLVYGRGNGEAPNSAIPALNWERAVLNLPGDKNYNLKLTWVYKVTNNDEMAADVYTYIDDQRCTGSIKSKCWCALQRVAEFMSLQSFIMTRREVGQEVEALSGSIVNTTGGQGPVKNRPGKVGQDQSLDKSVIHLD